MPPLPLLPNLTSSHRRTSPPYLYRTHSDLNLRGCFPPVRAGLQTTMEAVCILKGEKPDWDTAKRLLGDSNFMRSLETFDKDNISDATVKKLQP